MAAAVARPHKRVKVTASNNSTLSFVASTLPARAPRDGWTAGSPHSTPSPSRSKAASLPTTN